MILYRKPEEIVAFQYNGSNRPPGTCKCDEALSLHVHEPVTGRLSDGSPFEDSTITILESGDWLIQVERGHRVYSDEYIRASYTDEPSFTVLGRDQLAQATVVHWLGRAMAANVPDEKIRRARQRLEEIITFQSEHPDRVKRPD